MSSRATERRKAAVRAAWQAKAGKRADLAAHILERHVAVGGRIPTSWTAGDLARIHCEQHHRYRSRNHYHDGPNLGAGHRPPGWFTGLDVVEVNGA